MKKLLLVLAIASFAACNDAGSGDAKTEDTTATAPIDTAAIAPAPAPDTTTAVGDTTKPADTSAIKK